MEVDITHSRLKLVLQMIVPFVQLVMSVPVHLMVQAHSVMELHQLLFAQRVIIALKVPQQQQLAPAQKAIIALKEHLLRSHAHQATLVMVLEILLAPKFCALEVTIALVVAQRQLGLSAQQVVIAKTAL